MRSPWSKWFIYKQLRALSVVHMPEMHFLNFLVLALCHIHCLFSYTVTNSHILEIIMFIASNPTEKALWDIILFPSLGNQVDSNALFLLPSRSIFKTCLVACNAEILWKVITVANEKRMVQIQFNSLVKTFSPSLSIVKNDKGANERLVVKCL